MHIVFIHSFIHLLACDTLRSHYPDQYNIFIENVRIHLRSKSQRETTAPLCLDFDSKFSEFKRKCGQNIWYQKKLFLYFKNILLSWK